MWARLVVVLATFSAVLAVLLTLITLQIWTGNQANARGTLVDVCQSLNKLANKPADASPAIAACLSQLPPYATLSIAPGKYHLGTPLKVNRPITIETLAPSPTDCRQGNANHCAVFIVGQMAMQSSNGVMPVEIVASHVTLRSIAIIGDDGRSADWERKVCLNDRMRPLGGGIRVRGTEFHLENALIRNFSCYTAIEVVATALHPSIINSTIGPNGKHDSPQMWADGVTIHDSNSAKIERNLFLDNTDVQLILGGCRDCIIVDNVFRHSTSFSHASFAELMLHSWPNTSGSFSSSVISGNDINCGPLRRCGYGIMIGGEPWYPARTSGGIVSDNNIASAVVALNVDRLTGTMTLMRNTVSSSGGFANSDCSRRTWPAINIAPRSVGLVRTDVKEFASIDTTKCILLRRP